MTANVVRLEQQPSTQAAEFPIEPYEDVIFIEQDIEEKHRSGLILAGDYRKLPAGRVVAVGPGRYYQVPMDATGHNSGAVFVPTRTKVGDYVIFGRYQSGGEPLEINGKRYLLCREGDLAGKTGNSERVDVRIAIDPT